MKKVAVLGCGRLGTLIAGALAQGRVEGVALWGVFGRTQRRTHALAEKLSCPAADSIASLLAFGPGYVIEAAAGQVVPAVCRGRFGRGSRSDRFVDGCIQRSGVL